MKSDLIYSLRDPRTDEIRYIGKSTSGLQRPLVHFKHSHNKKVNDWMTELRNENLIPHIDILEELSEWKYLHIREAYWISLYVSAGCKLLNESSTESIEIRLTELEKQLFIKENVVKAKLQQLDNTLKEWDDLGKLIKHRRKMFNISQEDAAEMLSISIKTIHNIEKNKSNISFDCIKNYLNLLGIELVPKIKTNNNGQIKNL